jgi:hypothetical protein
MHRPCSSTSVSCSFSKVSGQFACISYREGEKICGRGGICRGIPATARRTCAVDRPEATPGAVRARGLDCSAFWVHEGAVWLPCNDWVFMQEASLLHWQATLGFPAFQCLAVEYSVPEGIPSLPLYLAGAAGQLGPRQR